jgi:hypothetical protein
MGTVISGSLCGYFIFDQFQQQWATRVGCQNGNSCPTGWTFTSIYPVSGGELIASCVKN